MERTSRSRTMRLTRGRSRGRHDMTPSPDLGLPFLDDETEQRAVRPRQSTIQRLTDLYGDTMTDLSLISTRKLSNIAAKNAKTMQKHMLLSSKCATQRFLGSDSDSDFSYAEDEENAQQACRDAKQLYMVWDRHQLEVRRRKRIHTARDSPHAASMGLLKSISVSFNYPQHVLGASASGSSATSSTLPLPSRRSSHSHASEQHPRAPGTYTDCNPQPLPPLNITPCSGAGSAASSPSRPHVPALRLQDMAQRPTALRTATSSIHGSRASTGHSPRSSSTHMHPPQHQSNPPSRQSRSAVDSPVRPSQTANTRSGSPLSASKAAVDVAANSQPSTATTPGLGARRVMPALTVSTAGGCQEGVAASPCTGGSATPAAQDLLTGRGLRSAQDTRRMLHQVESVLQDANEAPMLTHARLHTASLMAAGISPRTRTDGKVSPDHRPGSAALTSSRPGSPARNSLHLLPGLGEDALGSVRQAFTPRSSQRMADTRLTLPSPRATSPLAATSRLLASNSFKQFGGLEACPACAEHPGHTTLEVSPRDLEHVDQGMSSGDPAGLATVAEVEEVAQVSSEQLPPTTPPKPVDAIATATDLLMSSSSPLDYDTPRFIHVGGHSVSPYTGSFAPSTAVRQEVMARRMESVMQYNPAGFMEDVAASEVAAYRDAAERGRAILSITHLLPADQVGSQALKGSMQELHFRRPYFLPAPHLEPPGALSSDPYLSLGLRAARRPRLPGEADEEREGGEYTQGRPGRDTFTWRAEMSVFAPRAVESDARALNDNPSVKERQLVVDWRRVNGKASFKQWLATSDPNIRSNSATLEKVSEAVFQVLLAHWDLVHSSFLYYATADQEPGQVAMLMSLDQWNTLLTDCRLSDVVTPRTGDSVFQQACMGEEPTETGPEFEPHNKLMRFEFYEALVRLGSSRYLHSGMAPGTAEALRILFKQDLQAYLHPFAKCDPAVFRETRLYTQEVDAVLRRAGPVLHALYNCSCASAATRYLRLGQWIEILQLHGMLGSHTGLDLHQAALAFSWSQLVVVDEVQRRQRSSGIDLLDMAEALARLADMMSPPPLHEVQACLEATELMSPDELEAVMTHHPYHTYYCLAESQADVICFPRRASMAGANPPTRPLAEKLSAFLDYLLTSLCLSWDVPDTDKLIAKLNQVAAMMLNHGAN